MMMPENDWTPTLDALGPYAAVTTLALASLFRRIGQKLKGEESAVIDPPEGEEERPSETSAPRFERSNDRLETGPRSALVDRKAMELLLAMAQRIAATTRLDELEPLLHPTLVMVCGALGAQRGTLYFVDCSEPDHPALISYVTVGYKTEEPIILPARQGIPGDVLRLGTTVVSNDMQNDERHEPALEALLGQEVRNALAAPLKDAIGNPFGVFIALNKPGGFTTFDQTFIVPYIAALTDALYPHLSHLQNERLNSTPPAG